MADVFEGQEVLPKKTIWKRIADGWDKFDKWTDKIVEEHPEGCGVALVSLFILDLALVYSAGKRKGTSNGLKVGYALGQLVNSGDSK